MTHVVKVERDIKDKKLIIETGKLAKQADGSVYVRYGDTAVLATVVSEKQKKEGLDFFPLTIDYREKAYAAGKIPGGFFKRETRPGDKEVLTSRLIDRPIRPLFPKNFPFETQGIVSVLSYGDENISDIIGIIGISAAFTLSDIPMAEPVGAARIGLKEGEFIINPNLEEALECDLEITVAGTKKAVLMVEGGGYEVSEKDLFEAISVAHKEVINMIELQEELRSLIGKPKRLYEEAQIDEQLKEAVTTRTHDKILSAIRISDKIQRQSALDAIRDEAIEALNTAEEDRSLEINTIYNELEKNILRRMILDDNVRVDDRSTDEIRSITSEVGFLPKTHGSALFVRGETQCLAVTTLGTTDDEQRIDSLEGDFTKTFMLHYNFPPFSVGEVRPLRSAGRREVGHGYLAERALQAVIPDNKDFPYTIRLVSDILESNGSSSMATVCGGSLALMDAGVPLTAPVAGIAMGLVKEGDSTAILTDILGIEDHLGDMDFKVAGTAKGITAFQMDVKTQDMSFDILKEALEKARIGRLFILDKMLETLGSHRQQLAANAPRIYTMQIKQEKIRDVIGPGGKIIKNIIEMTGAKINIDDEGLVNIAALDESQAQKAMEIINGLVEEPEMGKIYTGKVKRIMDFGAFVEFLPGTEGLLHISQIAHTRIARVTDEIKEGDEFPVKVIEIDRNGRIRLSKKDAMPRQQEQKK